MIIINFSDEPIFSFYDGVMRTIRGAILAAGYFSHCSYSPPTQSDLFKAFWIVETPMWIHVHTNSLNQCFVAAKWNRCIKFWMKFVYYADKYSGENPLCVSCILWLCTNRRHIQSSFERVGDCEAAHRFVGSERIQSGLFDKYFKIVQNYFIKENCVCVCVWGENQNISVHNWWPQNGRVIDAYIIQ